MSPATTRAPSSAAWKAWRSGLLLEGVVRERIVEHQAPAHRTPQHPRRAGDQRVCLAAVLAAQAPVRAELRVSRMLAQTDETHRAGALQAAQQSEQVTGQSGATVAELRRLDVLDLPPAGHGAGVYGAEPVRAGVGVHAGALAGGRRRRRSGSPR